MKQYKDAILVPISDLHSGGSTALFPARQMQLLVGNREPGYIQKIIRGQWEEVIDNIRQCRNKRRVILVLNGDMVDGDHHGSVENFSTLQTDQIDIAEELIDELMQGIKFDSKTDSLYMTKGTYVHTGHQAQAEEQIAKDFDAVPFISAGEEEQTRRLHHQLKLSINGRRFNVQHEGASVGRRPWTEDNGLFYLLKTKWFKYLQGEHDLADYYIYSHLHQYQQATYAPRKGKVLNARITPSWQFRTSYAEKFDEMDKVGGYYLTVDGDGTVIEHLDQLEYMPAQVVKL